MAHLLPEQVVAARQYAGLGWPVAEIARRFEVSRSTIDRVVKGKTHARVQDRARRPAKPLPAPPRVAQRPHRPAPPPVPPATLDELAMIRKTRREA